MSGTMADRTDVTADELLAMGGGRRELVGGRVVEMTPGGADHGETGVRVGAELLAYARAKNLGRVYGADTGFVLRRGPDTVRAPDAAFVRKERALRTRKFFDGAPDLAVEVLSPGDTQAEIRERVADFLAAGTARVWVLDPASRTATVHWPDGTARHVAEGGWLDGEDLLPGLRIELAPLFAE